LDLRAAGKRIRAVPRVLPAWLVLVPLVLHALAREVDRALGLVLRAEIEPAGLLSEVGRALAAGGPAAALRVALWLAAGTALVAGLAWHRTRASDARFATAFGQEARILAPLLLRPALTLLALGSVALRPAYPYAFTLPVALTQDWGIAQDLLALAAILALRFPAPRFPAPRAGEVFLLSFLAYAALVPQWAWHWDSHPGNEPKTLRQAVALGHWLSFDAEPVTGAMEDLETRPLTETLPAAARGFAHESWQMLAAVARGEAGRDAIRATRVTRQTVRGKQGGVYSVLAPGPSVLLAPALRVDRAVNRARGETGRVAVSVLLFCGLGALLVAALFLLVQDATGRSGLAAALAFGFALVPPFLFYFHQFYPEMLGALVLALAFRTLALRPERLVSQPWRFGWLIAVLPWLHQKFLPVWGVLLVTALLVGWRSPAARALERPGWRWAVRLLLPNLLSLYLTAFYNFAITGSVRPDALFLAWGPGGVTSARIGQGLVGLLLDARYGILPYVPVLLLAGAGLVTGGARRFAPVLPAALAYYLTVASADNWSGAVCNLGRYVMPIAPLAVALVGMAIARSSSRRGAIALVLVLVSWTALVALALRQDPHAANDSALLLAKSAYADGLQYIPGLFIRTWADAAPGLALRIVAWWLLIAAVAFWLSRVARGSGGAGASPLRVLATVAATLLVVGLVLERAAPGARAKPSWSGTIATDPTTLVFLEGTTVVREDEAVIGPGALEILVRAPEPRLSLSATVGGEEGWLHGAGVSPIRLRPSGTLVEVPLTAYHEVRGRDRNAVFSRGLVWLEREAVLRPTQMEPGGDEVR
jgi:hypothetical protein